MLLLHHFSSAFTSYPATTASPEEAGNPDDIFIAVVFGSICPENQNFSFIDLKMLSTAVKAAKFLAEVSYFYDNFSIPEEGSFVEYYWFLDCSCCWFYNYGFKTLQEIISP
jgi:hypothetical protein